MTEKTPNPSMVRVILDTSVLVSAARSRLGASHHLVSLLPDARFQPVISPGLFLEYLAVLTRPENLVGRPKELAEAFLDYLISVSDLQEIFYLWRPFLPDADDDLVLEVAVAARAQHIVTHNLRDFRGIEKFGITALTPGSFLEILRNKL